MVPRPLPGKAVQVDPIKPTLKAPGTKRLKLKYDKLLSSFAFNFNLRHYTLGQTRLNVFAGLAAFYIIYPDEPKPNCAQLQPGKVGPG